jgi:hypothetical protein
MTSLSEPYIRRAARAVERLLRRGKGMLTQQTTDEGSQGRLPLGRQSKLGAAHLWAPEITAHRGRCGSGLEARDVER